MPRTPKFDPDYLGDPDPLTESPGLSPKSSQEPPAKAVRSYSLEKARLLREAWEDLGDKLFPSVGEAVGRAVKDVRANPGKEDTADLFVLARHLKAVPGWEPDEGMEEVGWFCTAVGIPADVGRDEFPDVWRTAQSPAGVDALAVASACAKARPLIIETCDTPDLTAAASLAFYLSALTRPRAFFLSQEAVGAFLRGPHDRKDGQAVDRAKKTGRRRLADLTGRGVILMVAKPVPREKAGEYLFTGRLEATP